MSEGGYSVYKRLNTEMIVDPGAWHVHLSSELRCDCVCVSVCDCLLTTSPVSVGAIIEIRQCYSNGCPHLSARILCQDNKLKEKE